MAKLPALQYVRSGLSQGLSANAALRAYRTDAADAGAQAMRRQDFLRLYSQTARLRSQVGDALTRPKDTRPAAGEIVRRDTTNARGYGQWVSIFQRTAGQADFISTPYLIKSARPLTPAEAEARALDYLDQQPDVYNRTTLGVAYVGTERFNPVL